MFHTLAVAAKGTAVRDCCRQAKITEIQIKTNSHAAT